MNPVFAWLAANPLYIWLAIFVIACVFEIATPSALVSFWFAVGALASMAACAMKLAAPAQIAVFVIVSLVCLFAVRPVAAKMLRGEQIGTGAERIIGKRFHLLSDVTDSVNGEIRVNDVLWKVKSAQSFIEKGTLVEVLAIDGAKLVVRPVKEN